MDFVEPSSGCRGREVIQNNVPEFWISFGGFLSNFARFVLIFESVFSEFELYKIFICNQEVIDVSGKIFPQFWTIFQIYDLFKYKPISDALSRVPHIFVLSVQ